MAGKRKAEAPLEGRRRSSRLQDKATQTATAVEPELKQQVSNDPISQQDTTKHTQPAAIEITQAKPKRFRRPRQRKKCGFLHKLPGEVRNRIYRYALVDTGDLEITSTGPGEPSLLRVCKRVRNEASSIYYAENNFDLQIQRFNGADLQPFIRQSSRYEHLLNIDHPKHTNISMLFSGSPNWDNLVAWIKSNHWGPGNLTPTRGDAVGHVFHFYDSAFKLAETMDMLPWAKVERALKALRRGLKGMPSPWSEGWDEDDW
ncbi:hypothetical protein Slin15195_G031330 [Septoria linicola]|uniref:Uncharacterized protein n=1 Tax=Septoria linicola TaxID=215465 RepID=A0A9Q9EHB2_9PEZI|nr:hypothetical protein Slin14017_G030350 [Septoria linicola]USW49814.1 hypothetical protein Slin15195_G031330 [Septoria linicola]